MTGNGDAVQHPFGFRFVSIAVLVLHVVPISIMVNHTSLLCQGILIIAFSFAATPSGMSIS